MKALFNRFNRAHSKDEVKDPRDSDSLSSPASSYQKEKLPQLPPLREWPPPPLPLEQRRRPTGTPTSITSYNPPTPIEDTLAFANYDIISISHSRGPLRDVAEEDSVDTTVLTRTASPRADQDSAGRSSRETGNGSITTTNGSNDVPKKVAFLSPPPTPSDLNADRPLPEDASTSNKSTAQPSHPKDPRGSMSTAASGPRPDDGSSKNSTQTVEATSTRSATSPYSAKPAYGNGASIHQSLRSATTFSQKTIGRVLRSASWSECAEEDLVTYLGYRERTRQEVLWEIVVSEERYVAELLKMKDTFIVPLLHPYATSSVASPTMLENDDMSRLDTPLESFYIPIASRFLAPLGFRSDTPTALDDSSRREDKDAPNIDSESLNSEDENDRTGKGFSDHRRGGQGNLTLAAKHNHPHSPYSTSRTGKNTSVPFPSRSHQSLPPPPRPNPNAVSTQSLGRQSYVRTSSPEKERHQDRSSTKADGFVNGGIAPHQLPDDLRQCLEAIEDSILAGHLKLSEDLRERYGEQYPLVRSLAYVFVANSHFLRGYADYVLHLERALEQFNDVISRSNSTKCPKNKDEDEWLKVCAFLRKLECDAQDRGETGLAISLSKPFQRLLKYPLLFQSLLFHTDPSTFEYESTLHMVAEVENIVRSIEDEKIEKDVRDKTRDILARIEGLDKVKQLAAPKPSRVLVEERILAPPVGTTKAVRGTTTFERLSDVLHNGGGGVGEKKDMWLVVFSDVVLRCQRTGTTSLPLGSAPASRANSLRELQGKSKYATTGCRNSTARPRNLYKFIKIENWTLGNSAQPREGVVSMEYVVRSRAQIHSAVHPRIVPMPDDDMPDDMSGDMFDDDKSKSNFSNRGADKITLQKPITKPRPGPGGLGTRRAARPSSRRTVTPSGRRPATLSDEGHSIKIAVTRPAWDESTRAPTSVQSMKRSCNTSQNSAATRTTTTPPNKPPAPSEDSVVGLYRQMMANDLSLNTSQNSAATRPFI